MTGIDSLNRGIKAIQQGSLDEGTRHLVLALRDTSLLPDIRAAVHIWMAETRSDINFKIQCYRQALTDDPTNEAAQDRLKALLASTLPPLKPDAAPEIPLPPAKQTASIPIPGKTVTSTQPVSVTPTSSFYRTVGVLDGMNGLATAFFVTSDGLLATTRLAVSGILQTRIELEKDQIVQGVVVRSFTDYDLAFIQTDVQVSRLLSFSRSNEVPDNMPLTAFPHNHKALQGSKRETKRELKPWWIPTSFRQLADLGGNPILDRNNQIVGMLTRVSSRSSDEVFGLEINHIRKLVKEYLQDVAAMPTKIYCPKCGNRSFAGSMNGFYCEHCGGVLPGAEEVRRFIMPELDRVYGENMAKMCVQCNARVGYWNGRCLRCGAETT